MAVSEGAESFICSKAETHFTEVYVVVSRYYEFTCAHWLIQDSMFERQDGGGS